MATQLEAAQKRYPKATPATKKVLEEIFGKEPFIPKVEQSTKFEDYHTIFKKMKFKDKFWLILQKRKATELTSCDMLMIIAEVLRNGWKADYSNSEQKKWFPYHQWSESASGFVFSFTAYAYTHAFTVCGSRFALPDDKTAEFFGKNFLPLWNDLQTIKY